MLFPYAVWNRQHMPEHFITCFGSPHVIHTDQGSDFTSQVMDTF